MPGQSAVVVTSPGPAVEPEALPTATPAVSPRRHVLGVLRQHPLAIQKLGLRPGASNDECLHRLASETGSHLYGYLKEAGCDKQRAACASDLLAAALREEQARQLGSCRLLRRRLCAASCLVLASALAAAAVVLDVTWTLGWREGWCSFSGFANGTCHQASGCVFEVSIVEMEPSQELFMSWQPPVEYDYHSDSPVWPDPPFRCCSERIGGSCCGLLDTEELVYCDNWGHRSDRAGKRCPSGDWQCLFQASVQQGREDASALKVYTQPPLWELLGAALACGLVGLAVWTSCFARCRAMGMQAGSVAPAAPHEPRRFIAKALEALRPRRPAAATAAAAAGAPRPPAAAPGAGDEDSEDEEAREPGGVAGPQALGGGRDRPTEVAVERARGQAARAAAAHAMALTTAAVDPFAAEALGGATLREAAASAAEALEAHPALRCGDLSAYDERLCASMLRPILTPPGPRRPPCGEGPARHPSDAAAAACRGELPPGVPPGVPPRAGRPPPRRRGECPAEVNAQRRRGRQILKKTNFKGMRTRVPQHRSL